jgi:hypothetical protein
MINGKLITEENLSHQEFISKLHILLKAYGIHFSGESKEIKNK